MSEVLVIGGYGCVGDLCVQELLRSSELNVVIAGRSIQRAERAALGYPGRARGAYLNAQDHRTMDPELGRAEVVIDCSAGTSTAAIVRAIEYRVPFISLTVLSVEPGSYSSLAEQAWKAELPVVLFAGAIPGLPGVLAERFVRRFAALEEIRIASTGAWDRTTTARTDLEAARTSWKQRERGRGLKPGWSPSRFTYPAPVGHRLVRAAHSPDLEGFSASHCVDRVIYLEPDSRLVFRGMNHVLAREAGPSFSLVAEAYADATSPDPVERIQLQARDVQSAAAVSASILAQAALSGRLPYGLLTPREALAPEPFLAALSDRGFAVDLEPAG